MTATATTTRTRVLPTPEDYAALSPRPGSPVWKAFNDARMLGTAGYAIMLQVAHPTVGAGVHQYSSFTKDPWGRLFRTLDYVHGTVYGGPELAGQIGARVRNMHKTIKGPLTDGSGERYSAMEPGAFAWVHATLAVGIVYGNEDFGRPMSAGDKQAFWAQWRDVGRLIGVRYRDLPEEWTDFQTYFDGVVRDELVWTPAVPEVLDLVNAPTIPPIPGLPRGAWKALNKPLSAGVNIVMAGMLPVDLRERLGIRYNRADQAAYRAFCAASKASTPLIRGPLSSYGEFWVRARAKQLARGDVAGSAQHPAGEPGAAAA
ncbi:MAG: DUF2236 domain-containing protein [Solirubrobacteraceae bacterium]|nr:DUF2236 domain-containing protein [Solirubrobacteraceae bacterium]